MPPRRTVIAAILLLALFVPAPLAATEKKTKEEKQKFGVYGGDPKSFADAADMFRRTARATGQTSAKLAELSVVLSTRRLPETSEATTAILRSAGSLTDAEYARLRQLAMDAGRRMARSKTTSPKSAEHLAAGNRLYEKGNLAAATQEYAAALRLRPDSLEARNNLGLAEMHLGYDVSAAFHFRLIQALDAKYAGGRTNLAVALARLGLWQEAYLTSLYAARDLPKSPIAHYNLGWFQNARADYAAAAKSIAFALQTLDTYDKALRLQALNELEAGRQPPHASIAAFPSKERSRLSISPSTVLAPPGIALRDRDRVAGTMSAPRELVVSDRRAPWIAVYWPDDVLKHRYWLDGNEARSGVAAALSGVWQLKRGGKPWATASFRQEKGALRISGVAAHPTQPNLHFNVDSVALDGTTLSMKIRYPESGERSTLKLVLGTSLRSMSGKESSAQTLNSIDIAAEKLRD